MPFKDKEVKNNYHKKYYHDKDLKKIQSDRTRLNYWRKVYCKLACITIEEFKKSFRMKWNEERIKINSNELRKTKV